MAYYNNFDACDLTCLVVDVVIWLILHQHFLIEVMEDHEKFRNNLLRRIDLNELSSYVIHIAGFT